MTTERLSIALWTDLQRGRQMTWNNKSYQHIGKLSCLPYGLAWYNYKDHLHLILNYIQIQVSFFFF